MRAHLLRIALCALAVAATSVVVWALQPIAPDVSLGALYTIAVLGVAVVWGLWYAVGVSIASLLAFNFLFLPPRYTFALSDSENWTALLVYLVSAVVASELAARARRRAAEAERRERDAALLADLASTLLQRGRVDELAARVEPTDDPAGARLIAAVESLLAVAAERERLERDALEAEALRRSDAVKTAVIRSVSHDLRTPLATIEAALDGLDGAGLELSERDRAELLATVRSELERLERFVENLLDLSRLQAGAAEPRRGLWSVDELVAQALDELPGSARVDVRIDDGVPPVNVDAAQVQRALVNVLDNALKFSPATAPVVVRARAGDHDVAIAVEDRGPGLADVGDAFEAFTRAPESGGAGLGLAIARGFAVANGGRVWAEPNEGGGTVFVVSLPAERLPAGVAG
jgi:two-component system, OmpR family, sensor histidine kinase KdpD